MEFNQTLFWDVDPKTIDVKKHSQYIIERILEFGSDKNVKWLFNTYKPNLLKKVVKQSRSLSPKTKSLWNLILK